MHLRSIQKGCVAAILTLSAGMAWAGCTDTYTTVHALTQSDSNGSAYGLGVSWSKHGIACTPRGSFFRLDGGYGEFDYNRNGETGSGELKTVSLSAGLMYEFIPYVAPYIQLGYNYSEAEANDSHYDDHSAQGGFGVQVHAGPTLLVDAGYSVRQTKLLDTEWVNAFTIGLGWKR